MTILPSIPFGMFEKQFSTGDQDEYSKKILHPELDTFFTVVNLGLQDIKQALGTSLQVHLDDDNIEFCIHLGCDRVALDPWVVIGPWPCFYERSGLADIPLSLNGSVYATEIKSLRNNRVLF